LRLFLRNDIVSARRRYLASFRADETTAGFAMEATDLQQPGRILLRVFVADNRDPGGLRRPALWAEC